MDDLISRAYVLAEYDRQHKGLPGGARKIIEDAPTIGAIPVVRCMNCKHRPTDKRDIYGDHTGFSIEFPDDRCPCQCEDGWYNWYPEDNWYCANGEVEEDE